MSCVTSNVKDLSCRVHCSSAAQTGQPSGCHHQPQRHYQQPAASSCLSSRAGGLVPADADRLRASGSEQRRGQTMACSLPVYQPNRHPCAMWPCRWHWAGAPLPQLACNLVPSSLALRPSACPSPPHPVGARVVARAVALGWLAPRRLADAALALAAAAAMRVVNRVHGNAAHPRPPPQPARRTRLAKLRILLLQGGENRVRCVVGW